jgi:extracellular elastinolytic metalloproteinase
VSHPRRCLRIAPAMLAALLLVSGIGGAASATPSIGTVPPPAPPADPAPAFDARGAAASPRALATGTVAARAALGRELGPMGVFQLDARTGTARVVGRLDGFLTPPSTAPPEQVALDFVRDNLRALGLRAADLDTFVLARDAVDIDGTHHLWWTQRVGGVRAFDNGLKASVTADGRLVSLSGSPASGLGANLDGDPRLSADAAIGRARASLGGPSTPGADDQATLVLFHGGRSRLAWQTVAHVSSEERYLSVVDAHTGEVLWRTNLVHAATGSGLAWEYFPSDAVPGGGGIQKPVTFPVRGPDRLAGNNAFVYADTLDDNRPDEKDQIPANSGLDWSAPAKLDVTNTLQNCRPQHACTWDRSKPKSWRPNRTQNAVQVYYYLNKFHDHLLAPPIGFTEAMGNFQAKNATGQGKGGDAVRAEILDGAAISGGLPDGMHSNNASMYTPPDGKAPKMQMYLFQRAPYAPGWPSANGGDDASVVYHEYTHGLTSRLVTYPNGFQALNTWQSAAMAEGWSDWYAMDLLVAQGWVGDPSSPGHVVVGQHVTGGQGIRYQALDCPVGASGSVCPAAFATGAGGYTYGDFGRVYQGPEVHADGEIWAQTMWDLRRRLDVGLSRRLITRAMSLSPPDPSFLDMRNAILQADVMFSGGANADDIWRVFRRRGMGFFASTAGGDDTRPTENFSMPPSCDVDPCGTVTGRMTDRLTGNPLKGVDVSIGGHDTGFPGTGLSARTGSDGRYVIRDVPFHRYPDVVIDRWGIEPMVVHDVRVDGTERLSRRLLRDWAALDGGANLVKATPPDYSTFGCGPQGAFDRSLVTGWGSDAPRVSYGSAVTGPRSVVVKLARTIDVTSFGVDPGATCGDGRSAGVSAFDIHTRTATGSWVLAYRTKSALPQGVLNRVVPSAGVRQVRFVKFTMRSNRGDPLFMDMSELTVRGRV